MISKYIKELIPGNSRIIIPEFGAFMIQDTPTGKVISFNDFLKFNDSVLLNKIITTEKVDPTQGKESIKAYIAEIEAAFKAGERFAVEGVGYLEKDSQNNINFVQDENAKASLEKTKKPAQPKTEAKPADAKPAQPKVETAPSKPLVAAAPTQPTSTVVTPKVEVKNQPAQEKKAPVQSQPASATTKNQTSYTNYTNNRMEIKTKNKTLTTVLIIVAGLVIVGVLVWAIIDFMLPRFRTAREPEVPAVVEEPVPAVDSTAFADTLQVVEEPEPVIVSEPVDPNSMHYHLIAGSFQVESNAIRFQQDMQSRGYNAVILTRNTGYHYVSIKQFETRSEAIAEWRNMTIENPNLWILIK